MNRESLLIMLFTLVVGLAVFSALAARHADAVDRQLTVERLAVSALTDQVKELRKAHDQCVEDASRQCLKNQHDCEEAVAIMRHDLAACRSNAPEDR